MGLTGETYPARQKPLLANGGALGAPRERRECRLRQLRQNRHAGEAHFCAYPIGDGQVGFPRTMRTDASLGLPCMAYPSAHVAMSLCKAEKFASVRLAGTASRAHSALRADPARRARAGNCKCCTMAAHVVPPPTYALGEFCLPEERGLTLRKTDGPGAPRRLAARQFARKYGS